jgi:putative FmdB family regulatory protein
MPTYEYRCIACKHQFEVFQSITEGPRRKCPECGRNALERLIGTGAAVLFKGSGFYQTDYRSESYKKAAKAETKPAAASGDGAAKPGGESKSEIKPAEKTAGEAGMAKAPKKEAGGKARGAKKD